MTYFSEVMALAPIWYARLDEAPGATTMVDSSGNSRHGTYRPSGLTFGGASAVIDGGGTSIRRVSNTNGIGFIPDAAWMNAPACTWVCWFRGTVAATAYLVTRYDSSSGLRMYGSLDLNGAGAARFVARAGGGNRVATSTRTGLFDNQWHMVVGTYDPAATTPTVKVYVDGKLEGSLVTSGAFNSFSGGQGLLVGAGDIGTGVDAGSNVPMDYDEAAFYDKALTATQITTLYRAGIARAYASKILALNPLGYWRFGESTGATTLVDSSGNAHDGSWITPGGLTFGVPGAPIGEPDTAVTFPQVASSYGQVVDAAWMNVSTNFTYMAWFKMSTVSANKCYVINRYNQGTGVYHGEIHVETNGSVTFTVRVGISNKQAISPATTYRDNQWHMAVGTYDGNSLRLYLDGALVQTTIASGTVTGGTGGMGIVFGVTENNGAPITGGNIKTIDETAFFDTLLDAPIIADLYTTGLLPPVTAPFTGSGKLGGTAAAVNFYVRPVNFAGGPGAFNATVGSVQSRSAPFTGRGALSATTQPRVAITAPFGLSGGLTADVGGLVAVSAGFSGQGAFSAITHAVGASLSELTLDLVDYPEIQSTPTNLVVQIGNGLAGEQVTFSVSGPTSVLDFQTTVLDADGHADEFSVELPPLLAGAYVLRATGPDSGSDQVTFTVLEDALSYDDDPPPPPVPPITDPTTHWRFIDLFDPTITWQMPHNPAIWSNLNPPNNLTDDKTTAPNGQLLTWQSGARPWRMEFAGYLDTQEEYDNLVFWAGLHRRFWLIDHRNRSWLLTFEQFDARARVTPGKPWSHDFTVKALIFMQGTD